MKKVFIFSVKVILSFCAAFILAIFAEKISCYQYASISAFIVGGIFFANLFGMFDLKEKIWDYEEFVWVIRKARRCFRNWKYDRIRLQFVKWASYKNCKVMIQNEDRMKLDYQRGRASQYFVDRYSREQRYLIILQRDFEKYLDSAEYLKKKDTENQFYFDFLCDYESLLAKMKEFRWSSDFLKENGIDFKAIRKLYFAAC